MDARRDEGDEFPSFANERFSKVAVLRSAIRRRHNRRFHGDLHRANKGRAMRPRRATDAIAVIAVIMACKGALARTMLVLRSYTTRGSDAAANTAPPATLATLALISGDELDA